MVTNNHGLWHDIERHCDKALELFTEQRGTNNNNSGRGCIIILRCFVLCCNVRQGHLGTLRLVATNCCLLNPTRTRRILLTGSPGWSVFRPTYDRRSGRFRKRASDKNFGPTVIVVVELITILAPILV